jgi:hypothetical protein
LFVFEPQHFIASPVVSLTCKFRHFFSFVRILLLYEYHHRSEGGHCWVNLIRHQPDKHHRKPSVSFYHSGDDDLADSNNKHVITVVKLPVGICLLAYCAACLAGGDRYLPVDDDKLPLASYM